MTVATETNRTAELTTDGVVEDFDFDMLIHATSEVQVWYEATGGAYTQLTLETDYGVVFTEDGGTVSTNGYTAPLAAGKLLIIRHIPGTMETNWLYLDNHSEGQHQSDFDRSVMRYLQLLEQIERAVKFAITSDTKDITFPEPVANQMIGWDAAGTGLENKPAPAVFETANWIGKEATAADVAADYATAEGNLIIYHKTGGFVREFEAP